MAALCIALIIGGTLMKRRIQPASPAPEADDA
jgi:hypothetical protein